MKSSRPVRCSYFYDAEAIREPYQYGEYGDHPRTKDARYHAPGQPEHTGLRRQGLAAGPDGRRKTTVAQGPGSAQHRDGERWPNPSGRNRRSVWEIATEPYPDAHFATFPTALVEPCILAGTSERGVCPECGAPWVREVDREPNPTKDQRYHGLVLPNGDGDPRYRPHGDSLSPKAPQTLGWHPGCGCYDRDGFGGPLPARSDCRRLVPATVLDPFFGSGTVGVVARKHGRRCVGIELNETYCELASRRLSQLSLLSGLPQEQAS